MHCCCFSIRSGARVSEAAQLTIQDLDWYARAVQILGKGRKVRTCPLWPQTIKVLRPLVAGRAPTEPVFLNRNREPFTRSGIYGLVKRYARRAAANMPSIGKKTIGPHVDIRQPRICFARASISTQSGGGSDTHYVYFGLSPSG